MRVEHGSCVMCDDCVQVQLTRLPVGHTHEDVDQKFSIISRVRLSTPLVVKRLAWRSLTITGLLCLVGQHLATSNVVTPEEFKEAVLTAFRSFGTASDDRVHCIFEDVWAVQGWGAFFKSQPAGVWPSSIHANRLREETQHLHRFQRSLNPEPGKE